MKKGLLIVDVQNDFCPGGALPVPHGNEIISYINRRRNFYDKIFFSLDSHPPKHMSFEEEGGMWPSHCVVGTKGHELHPKLEVKITDFFIYKGLFQHKEEYSAFYDLDIGHSILAEAIEAYEIKQLDICGLASEYCVFETAKDASSIKNLKVNILLNGCKGINKEEIKKRFTELKELNINFVS